MFTAWCIYEQNMWKIKSELFQIFRKAIKMQFLLQTCLHIAIKMFSYSHMSARPSSDSRVRTGLRFVLMLSFLGILSYVFFLSLSFLLIVMFTFPGWLRLLCDLLLKWLASWTGQEGDYKVLFATKTSRLKFLEDPTPHPSLQKHLKSLKNWRNGLVLTQWTHPDRKRITFKASVFAEIMQGSDRRKTNGLLWKKTPWSWIMSSENIWKVCLAEGTTGTSGRHCVSVFVWAFFFLLVYAI